MASRAQDAAATPLPQPKAIRFVSNNDGPYAKRRRINAACLTCRRRKTRCSGERPVCETCLKNNHACGGYGGDSEPVEVKNERRASHSSLEAQQYVEKRTPPPARRWSMQQQPQHSASSNPSLSHLLTAESFLPDSQPASSQWEDSQALNNRVPLSLSVRNRMPYFRYFGPTAIMPGFKQMVVKVKGKQHSGPGTSTDGLQSPHSAVSSLGRITPLQNISAPVEMPLYDTSSVDPPPLITHLCKTFFSHLGCSFPFLQEERFMRDLEEKQVDAILVDSVCALAARFSTDPMLVKAHGNGGDQAETPRSEYGQAFAQRAKAAIVDTFSCPSVAAVQAALLLAYDEFGANRDSGLWMYLGIAIRMAQDLGMQTLQGLKYEGRDGPTPENVKSGASKTWDSIPSSTENVAEGPLDQSATENQKAVERERVDTFWAIFFADRVVSSGTGRPVSLRDRDIEISFPSLDAVDPATGCPMPFPALIRVIHLYGRVTDILNSIKQVSDVTPEIIKRLARMENQLTDIYQNLSPRLHFNVVNFQHYLKNGQGTNFILLHFWFHTLIVLLHQPTLLKTFEGGIQQLLPNSHELSMSSAKTIADILAFAELADAKAALVPFTSQPMYIAACAFLKETAMQSASSHPHSRQPTPPRGYRPPATSGLEQTNPGTGKDHKAEPALGDKQISKHTLLATAANQNYQRCYRALQALETYWSGTKYILTVLDQKAKGVGDPLLYTREEMECALELPRPDPSFRTPGWRRKLALGTYIGPTSEEQEDHDGHGGPAAAAALAQPGGPPGFSIPGSPIGDPSQAIGWSLTGTMNSPSTSLAVLYQTEPPQRAPAQAAEGLASISSTMALQNNNNLLRPSSSSALPPFSAPQQQQQRQQQRQQNHPPHPTQDAAMPPPPPSTTTTNNYLADPSLVSDADLLLNLHSPFVSSASPGTAAYQSGHPTSTTTATTTATATATLGGSNSHSSSSGALPHAPAPVLTGTEGGVSAEGSIGDIAGGTAGRGFWAPANSIPFGDVMVESQDIDMSALGDEIGPWLEYLPFEMVGWFEGAGSGGDGGGGEGKA